MMLGSGAGNVAIKYLALLVTSSNSDNEDDGGLYMRIMMREGSRSLTMRISQTELE